MAKKSEFSLLKVKALNKNQIYRFKENRKDGELPIHF